MSYFSGLIERERENRVCRSCGHNEKTVGKISYADGLCQKCYDAEREERALRAITSRRRE